MSLSASAYSHVTGHPSTEYVSEETPMVAYSNLHIAFEQMRVRALRAIHGSPASGDEAEITPVPPRVLVLGPENSGKTTVCKILTNYAVRAGQDWAPLLINTDPSEVSFRVNCCRITPSFVFFLRVVGRFQGRYQPLPYIPRCQHVLLLIL
jgi:mRNA cleavage and polyadenylation factor CLP1 P-loop/N-terminal beta-sandwich domain of polyadenylation factor